MKKIQCELCGGVEVIKIDDSTFQCCYCGCKYNIEQARQLISGVVEITKGNAELNRLLNNAEMQIKLDNSIAAYNTYNKLSEEYPAEYRVWNGLLNVLYNEIDKSNSFDVFNDSEYKFSIDFIQNSARKTCPENEKVSLNNNIDSFWNKIYNKINKGQFNPFHINGNENYDQFETQLKKICSYHPLMKKLIDEGIRVAIHMNNIKIHYGYLSSRIKNYVSFWPNHLDIVIHSTWIAIGYICVHYVKNFDNPYVEILKMPYCAFDSPFFYSQIEQTSNNNINKLVTCPLCGIGKIKKNLLGGKSCSSCKAVIVSK